MVAQVEGRPIGTQTRAPSHPRCAHWPERQSAFVVHDRQSIEPGQSVGSQAHVVPQVPVAGPVQVVFTRMQRPDAPHHPQPGSGVQVAQFVPAAHGSVGGTSVPLSATEQAQGPKPEALGRHICTPVVPPAHAQETVLPGSQAAVPASDGVTTSTTPPSSAAHSEQDP